MTGTIELYKDTDAQWRWRAIAPNGEIIATGESHKRRWNARRAARSAFPGWVITRL